VVSAIFKAPISSGPQRLSPAVLSVGDTNMTRSDWGDDVAAVSSPTRAQMFTQWQLVNDLSIARGTTTFKLGGELPP